MATREETAKMIEVMQAYVDGKEIEYKDHMSKWAKIKKDAQPSWSWDTVPYRVAQPKPKKVKLRAYLTPNGEFQQFVEGSPNDNSAVSSKWQRAPSKDEELEV